MVGDVVVEENWIYLSRQVGSTRLPRVWFLYYFLRTSSVGGGHALPDFLFLFSFPCPAEDHERDYLSPCKKVVFLGLATNTLNIIRNNKQQQAKTTTSNGGNIKQRASSGIVVQMHETNTKNRALKLGAAEVSQLL